MSIFGKVNDALPGFVWVAARCCGSDVGRGLLTAPKEARFGNRALQKRRAGTPPFRLHRNDKENRPCYIMGLPTRFPDAPKIHSDNLFRVGAGAVLREKFQNFHLYFPRGAIQRFAVI